MKNQNPSQTIVNETHLAMRVSVISVIVNLVLSAFKLLAGIFANSGAMISDAVHSASDVFSTFIVMIGVTISGKKADKEHPYGHARFEYLASLVVAAMILVIGFELAKTSVLKLIHPASIEFSMLMIMTLTVSPSCRWSWMSLT